MRLPPGCSPASGQHSNRQVSLGVQSHICCTDPNVTILKAQFFPEHKSQRVMIRYGPFTVPPISEDNGMKNFDQMAAQVPCTDCLVTWMQAGLTYEDGSEANADK